MDINQEGKVALYLALSQHDILDEEQEEDPFAESRCRRGKV